MKKKIKVLSLLAVAALGGAGVLAIGTNGMMKPFGITASEDNVRSFVVTAEEIRAALGGDGSSTDRKSGTFVACGLGFSVSGAYYADGKINIAGGSIYNSDLAGATVDANNRVGTGFKQIEIKGLDSKNGLTASFQDDSLTDIEAISVAADSAGDKTVALSKSGKASRVKLEFATGEGTSFTSIVFTYTCGDATPLINHIVATKSEISVGDSCVLTAVTSYTTSAAEYTWTSSNADIANVQKLTNGSTATVSGQAEGEATITCVLHDGEHESTATYTIRVTKADAAATSVTIADKSSVGTMTLHDSVKLSATATPADTTDTIAWSSSDTNVLSVGSDGTVIAMGEGSATITATCGSVTDTVSITVAGDPSLDASKITNLHASYKASVTHSHLVDVTHGGKSKDDAFDYKADTPITSTYSGTLPPDGVLAMHLSSSDVSDGDNHYVKFSVTKTGTYKIFTNNVDEKDMKLNYVYEVLEDGTVSSTAISGTYNDDFSKSGADTNYCLYKYDSCVETALTAGKTYIVAFYAPSGGVGTNGLLFGIVNVETADGVTTVTNATGEPAQKTVTDPYSFTYIENEGVYRQNADSGVVNVEGALHQFSHNAEDDEYVYENAAMTDPTGTALAPSYLANLLSWDAILSNSVLEYVGSSLEGHIDTYSVDIDSSNINSLGTIASFIYFLGLNEASVSVSKFAVAHDYVNRTATISLTFEDTTEPDGTVVTIEETDAFPVAVVGHNVHNGGAGGSDSGVDQEW